MYKKNNITFLIGKLNLILNWENNSPSKPLRRNFVVSFRYLSDFLFWFFVVCFILFVKEGRSIYIDII